MDKNYEKLKETISEYEKNCKCVQALLFTMMSVEDPTKLKVWNKNLKTIMMDMNSSYTHLNLEMLKCEKQLELKEKLGALYE